MKTILFHAVILLLLAVPQFAFGQRLTRIAGLVADDQFVPALDGFKKKMAELGYTEGKNILYEFENAKGNSNALKSMAQKLIQSKPDLVVTSSTTATVPVVRAVEGTDLPVVFLSAGDPLRFVKSYASSGNNLTGISTSSLDLIEKRVELLQELSPKINRIIALSNPKGANYRTYLRLEREAANRLNLGLTSLEFPAAAEGVKKTISLITRELGDALLVPSDLVIVAAAEGIAQQAIRQKIPSVAPIHTVRKGLLAGYGSDYFALGQQGAVLVDKILKGARPTDLPIEQPLKLNLVINLKTAKAIGLKIPREVLLRADDVIE
jgi:putative ABC transport system substrate-binding protein